MSGSAVPLLPNSDMESKTNTDMASNRSQKSRGSVRSTASKQPVSKVSSSIPLPVRSPKSQKFPISNASSSITSKIPKGSSTATIRSTATLKSTTSGVNSAARGNINKHSLEMQFMNKRKRLQLLNKELAEKQRPVLELYQNLQMIKKRLEEEYGKAVCLEPIKVLTYDQLTADSNDSGDSGQMLSLDMFAEMQNSIQQIPKTLMDICQNLLDRRNVIVELLESVVKSEVNATDLNDQIDTMNIEGVQLQNNLNVLKKEHEIKIIEIIKNWQLFLKEKRRIAASPKIDELQEKLKLQEKLTEDARAATVELQKKLDERRSGHDRTVGDLNSIINTQKEQIYRLEQELEAERKIVSDLKNRNTTNTQTTKNMRNKLSEFENNNKTLNNTINELNKKLKLTQDQLKHKETQFNKERDEYVKNLKHQENLLQKLNAEKISFETRLGEVQGQTDSIENELRERNEVLDQKCEELRKCVEELTKERNDALEKSASMQEELDKLNELHKEKISNMITSLDWGKKMPNSDDYSKDMHLDVMLTEKEDMIKHLKNEVDKWKLAALNAQSEKMNREAQVKVAGKQNELISQYQERLLDNEQKLSDKIHEVAEMAAEMRKLRMRQEHMDREHFMCSPEKIESTSSEGRSKLREVLLKLYSNEQKMIDFQKSMDAHGKYMNSLENMVRYRENIAGVLKASKDELILQKESLTKYTDELKVLLAQVVKESKMKDRLIKEKQDNIRSKEEQLAKLRAECCVLQTQLYKLSRARVKNIEKE